MNESDQIIEDMIHGAEKAKESNFVGQVISRGDQENQPFQMVATKLQSAGYSYIYDTVTGERSVTNNNMLPAQLKKRRPDGSFVFTVRDPHIPLKRGSHKCMLHPDDPNRDVYDELGLPVCKKSNLTNPFQVRRHMQKRHKAEWEVLEERRKDQEKAEETAFRRQMMGERTVQTELSQTDTEPETYVSDKPYVSKRKKR